MQDEVKSQHMDRAIKFLVNELKVCQSKAEAEERIFFISAKEALHTRMQVSWVRFRGPVIQEKMEADI